MAFASFLNMYFVFTSREFLSESTPAKPWIEYFRLDDSRLQEWKTVLSNPHLDSRALETGYSERPGGATDSYHV